MKKAQDDHEFMGNQAAAELIGISAANYSQWLYGDSLPSRKPLQRLAEFLDLPVDQVVERYFPRDHVMRNRRYTPVVDPFDALAARMDEGFAALAARIAAVEERCPPIPGPSVGPQFDQDLPETGL